MHNIRFMYIRCLKSLAENMTDFPPHPKCMQSKVKGSSAVHDWYCLNSVNIFWRIFNINLLQFSETWNLLRNYPPSWKSIHEFSVCNLLPLFWISFGKGIIWSLINLTKLLLYSTNVHFKVASIRQQVQRCIRFGFCLISNRATKKFSLISIIFKWYRYEIFITNASSM